MDFLSRRPRRNRKTQTIRHLVSETKLDVNDLVAPLFLIEDNNEKQAIEALPGQFRFGLNPLLEEIHQLSDQGIPCVSLFPALKENQKDPLAKKSYDRNLFYVKAIEKIKSKFPHLSVMTDVAMDPYSSDGHDGVVNSDTGEIENDQTLEILAKMALNQANSGSDIIGPSDMMDGRVAYLRKALDEHDHQNVSIMSYTAKYCSNFYGPFREALDSAPKAGDKKTYQMDFHNKREALLEAQLDEQEGADILMVKPGLPYLDVVSSLRQNSQLPIAVYNVSGEYAMIKALSEKGGIDSTYGMYECLVAFKRAGADMILTYFAKEAAIFLNQSR